MRPVMLGIDIGGTNTAYGFVDEDGGIVYSGDIPTLAEEGAEKLLERLADVTSKGMAKLGDEVQLCGVGIGAPNGNYYTGNIENPPNLGWPTVPFARMMSKKLSLPVAITNDANATAIGEKYFGAARDMENFVVITLGTGLGSGIYVNNELVYGEDGFAGELGHTCVQVKGRDCACGNQGCLETYVSATGLKRTAFELLARRTGKSPLRETTFNNLSGQQIAEFALAGDTIAREAFQITGEYLGVALANAAAFSRPEAFILFGGMAAAGELIVNPTYLAMERHLLAVYRGKINIITSALPGSSAAVLGAAALAWNEAKNTGEANSGL